MRINFYLLLSRHNLGIYSADQRIRMNINEADNRHQVHTVSAIIVALYIESYYKAVEVEAHRNVHGVDAVVEAPGEGEVGAGVGDHPARDLQCLLLVGLEHGLGARAAHRLV